MRILIYSDLHNEFTPFVPEPRVCAEADAIVLAGDIDLKHYGVDWAQNLSASLGGKPILMVAGNHEFYGGHFDHTLADLRQAARGSNVHVLENDSLRLNGVRFLGCSLWTDFKLYGVGDAQRQAVEDARQQMTDFKRIHFGPDPLHERKLHPLDTTRRHTASRAWLEHEMAAPFDGPTVVITHHGPSGESIPLSFRGQRLSPAYASDLESLMRPSLSLWIHGHVHESCDYTINGTRVLCNPRGYVPIEPNPRFHPAMLVVI